MEQLKCNGCMNSTGIYSCCKCPKNLSTFCSKCLFAIQNDYLFQCFSCDKFYCLEHVDLIKGVFCKRDSYASFYVCNAPKCTKKLSQLLAVDLDAYHFEDVKSKSITATAPSCHMKSRVHEKKRTNSPLTDEERDNVEIRQQSKRIKIEKEEFPTTTREIPKNFDGIVHYHHITIIEKDGVFREMLFIPSDMIHPEIVQVIESFILKGDPLLSSTVKLLFDQWKQSKYVSRIDSIIGKVEVPEKMRIDKMWIIMM